MAALAMPFADTDTHAAPGFSFYDRPVQAKATPLDLNGKDTAPVGGDGVLVCCGCAAEFTGDELEFTEAPVCPAGRWMVADGGWWHMCHGYAAVPEATEWTVDARGSE